MPSNTRSLKKIRNKNNAKNKRTSLKKYKKRNNTYFHKGGEITTAQTEYPVNGQEELQNNQYLNNTAGINDTEVPLEGNENTFEEENQNQAALTSSYNNPDKIKPQDALKKKIMKNIGGLSLTYPPPIDNSKEMAIQYKMEDKRQPGFTAAVSNNNSQTNKDKNSSGLNPKFEIDEFYPPYSIFYQIEGINPPESAEVDENNKGLVNNQ